MKKIILTTTIAFIGLSTIIISCQKETNSPESTSEITSAQLEKYPFFASVIDLNKDFKTSKSKLQTLSIDVLEAKPKFRFRWDGCDRPLGVCLVLGLYEPGDVFLENEGYANVKIIDNLMYIQPNQKIALTDNTVPISNDVPMSEDFVKLYGYNSITIKKGLYRLNPNDGEFGSVVVNIDIN